MNSEVKVGERSVHVIAELGDGAFATVYKVEVIIPP